MPPTADRDAFAPPVLPVLRDIFAPLWRGRASLGTLNWISAIAARGNANTDIIDFTGGSCLRKPDRNALRAECIQFGLIQCSLHPTGIEPTVTQGEINDILGVSSLNVNRALERLRYDGLIVLTKRRGEIPDVACLAKFCQFDPNYLHLTPHTAKA